MSNLPPQENPYASPAVDLTSSQQESATTNLRPPALVPRWWEWMWCGLLLVAFGAIVWDSVYVMQKGAQIINMDVNPFGSYNNFVSAAIGSALGLVVLRIWWWRQLPEGLAPGHVILLVILFSTLVSLVDYVLLVATFQFSLMTPSEVADSGTIDFIIWIGSIVSSLGVNAILVTLMYRNGLWFAAACVYLFRCLVDHSYAHLSAEQSVYSPQADGETAVIPFLLYVFSFAVALSFLAIAIHERWRGIRRDWLHWAGIVCWASFLVVGIAEDIWWNLE